jgi:hypothetical protein
MEKGKTKRRARTRKQETKSRGTRRRKASGSRRRKAAGTRRTKAAGTRTKKQEEPG